MIKDLWDKADTKGGGCRVAVLDTGVYGDHPSLANRVKEFALVDPLGRIIRCEETFDSGQHGTHVCGTICGDSSAGIPDIGLAPEVNLLVSAVLVGQATLDTLLSGLSWAVESEADIVNMSLGFSYYEPYFELIMQEILDYDVVPVVAVGNDSHGSSSCPGNIPSVLSVGAIGWDKAAKEIQVAPFSSGATITTAKNQHNVKPDIVAPGVDILSCIPTQKTQSGKIEYAHMSGTSMAAPDVSGVCAILRSAFPMVHARIIIDVLKETADHPDHDNRPENKWGYGVVNPMKAYEKLAQLPAA
ncbi:MAG: S8 family serine peptidase [Paracoccaceae bacterium]